MNFYRIICFFMVISILGCDDDTSDFGLTNTFVKFYGDANNNIGIKGLATADGGYLVAGYTTFGDTARSAHLFKTNALGNQEWSLVVDTGNFNTIKDVIIDNDGNYLLLSDQFEVIGGDDTKYDIALQRVSATGELIEIITFDSDGLGTYNDYGNGIIQTADGGYVIIGSTNNTSGGDSDMYVLRLNSSYAVVWEKVYGNVNGLADEGKAILEDENGDLLWFGTEQVGTSDTRIRMVRTNSLGNILWDFNYPIVENNNIIASTGSAGNFISANDGFVFTGNYSNRGIVLAKIDDDGQEVWFKQFTSTGGEQGKALTKATDNTLVIAGKSSSSNISDMILIKTDIQGNFIWSNVFGYSGLDEANSVTATENGGVVFTGNIAFDDIQMMALTKVNADGAVSQ